MEKKPPPSGDALEPNRRETVPVAKKEQALAPSFLQAVFDGFPESLMVINRDYSIALANRAVREASGHTDPVADGLTCHEVSHASASPCDCDEKHPCPMQQVLATGKPVVLEHLHYDQSGQPIPVEVMMAPILNEDGEAVQVIEFSRNIAEQKKNEEDLTRLSAAINQAAETIVITASDGTIEYTNPAFEAITGYSCEEAVGRNPRILKSGKQDQAFYRELWDTISSGKTWKGRFINRCKNGELYVEDAVISPVRDNSGTIVNYVAVKRDITEQLHLEQQFRQAQKMDEMGRLSSGIAHDFNNILQSILGFNELLMEDLKDQPSPLRKLREVEKAAKRAAELTQGLLAFSREDSADSEPLDINSPIRETEHMIERLIGINIQCVLHLAQELEKVPIASGKIAQIILNLAVNARDAMPDGGRLTFSTANITFSAKDAAAIPEIKEGKFICLSVTDTGTGMTKAVKEHLFEPFFTTKAVNEGTGLGLSVIYGIVKQHGGWIHVYSEVSHGTTIKIYLPVHEARPSESEPPAGAEGRGERILLVEDDMTLRNLCIRILLGEKYQVFAAGSLQEARSLSEREGDRFDLLFSDIMLPDGSGIELADELRRKMPALPVVLCSGYGDARERWSDLPKKDYHFMQKPFTVTGLAFVIRQAMFQKSPSP